MTACQSSGTLITVSNADGIGVVNGEGHIVLPVKYYSVSIQGDTKVVGFGPPMRGQSSDEHVAFANATQLDSKLDASDPTLTLPESFSEGLECFIMVITISFGLDTERNRLRTIWGLIMRSAST